MVCVRAPNSKWCGLLTSVRELPAPWGEVVIFVDPLGIVGKVSHAGCRCRMAEVAWQSVRGLSVAAPALTAICAVGLSECLHSLSGLFAEGEGVAFKNIFLT